MKKTQQKQEGDIKAGNRLVQKYGRGVLKENLQMYGMMLPSLILILVFCYIPLYGLIIAFQDYVPGASFLGLDRQNYKVNPTAFPWVYTLTNIWKSFGFNSILYCSIISSIDPGLYEAAKLDGANRFQQVWHVTLPGLRAVIAINLIMAVGAVLSTNTDLVLLLYDPATYDVADVIGTYTYRIGILEGQYSYTTAAGLFTAMIGFVLTFAANKISDKLTGYGLW